MSDGRHVNADLVGAASLDVNIDQRELAERRVDASPHLVMRHRGASFAALGGHTCAAYRIAADGGVDGAAVFRRPTVYQGDVPLLHFASGKLQGQLAMDRVVLGYDDQATGFLVEAMNDSGP